MPRLFRMAGRRPMPPFFDIDDTVSDRTSSVAARPPAAAQHRNPEEDER